MHDTGDKKARTAEVFQTGPDTNGFVSIRKTLPQPAWTVEGVGTLVSSDGVWTRSIREGDPNSSVWLVEWTREMKRGEWNIKTRSTVELTSTADEFRMKESIAAWERETKVFERAWDKRIRRDLM
jgi:hypothetical protein